MTSIRIAIAGFGNVGRAFARHVLENRSVQIVAVADSTGSHAVQSTRHLQLLLQSKETLKQQAGPTPEPPSNVLPRFVDQAVELGASILVDALPTNIETGQPGLDLIRSALSKGLHVVTVDKGPMVCAFHELVQTAAQSGRRLEYTGTIGVAIPDEISGLQVLEIRGVLNGTTNYILTEMQSGAQYDEALATAQERGIAEPDPSLDVEGWDTACKIFILAKTLMRSQSAAEVTVEDVVRAGIGPEVERLVRIARDTSRVVRLVGRARIWQGRLRLSVCPKLIGPESPFYSVTGTSKAAVFRTRERGEVLSEAHSGRATIADVILRDALKASDSPQIDQGKSQLVEL